MVCKLLRISRGAPLKECDSICIECINLEKDWYCPYMGYNTKNMKQCNKFIHWVNEKK